ncbi:MAG: GAF domain-containing sensor histidine kinase [Candidatus Omnitrophica bacterium]|nr:GAF domain-containing sensor histidine kinase [Candidatus Omnitrophota bacterium]
MFEVNTVLAFIGLLVVIALTFLLLSKDSKMNSLQAAVDNLQRALDEMDEQAKLVVRTDIELNKAQEELDRKITSLYTLQKLSRTISSTLEENQIFKKVELSYLADLGFQKALAFLFDEKENKFSLRLSLGYEEEEAAKIKTFIDAHKETYNGLIHNEKAVSSIASRENPADTKSTKETFGVVSFVFAPILAKEGNPGLLFVGAEKTDTIITEGDEELITILANQIGQALENARLFEKTWQAHQDLENRVEERTRELSRALEEVKKLSQRKNDFVSNVSHELRTPLTSIKGYASILLSGKLGVLPEEVGKRLAKINKHSDELVSFVNDLLDLSRIESGKVELKLAPLNLKSIVDEVADLLAVQFKEKQIEFSSESPADLPEVMADYSQIKRTFINLINNSVKYTPQGKIKVSLTRLDKEVQVDVSDTGCGMPESAMDKLFTEFYRVDSVMNQEIKGTGLGLAMVKNIVTAHKGKIWVKSKVGSGTTFSFTLPQAY